METYESRKDVPDKYKWDLNEFYHNDNEWNDDYNKLSELVLKLKDYVGCTSDATKLYDFLTDDIEASRILMNLDAYAYLINDEELGKSENIERISKISNLENEYALNTNFFNSELLKLSKDEYNNLYKNNSKLNEFKIVLDEIYEKKEHILPEKEENIVTTLENAMNNYDEISSTLLNSCHDYGSVVIDGKETKITSTNLRKLYKNDNRDIRKETRSKYNKTLDQYGVISAYLLNDYVKANIEDCKLHNYKDAWDAKLTNLHMLDKAYDAITEVVESNTNVLQNYYKLYKKALKLDKLYQYDLSLDLNKDNKEYSVEEAQDICLKAIKPLGDDYYNHFKKVFDNHYIDYCTYKGKCSGGYSLSTLDKDSRILLSFDGTLDSVSTIIHEGGHNVHHQYVSENNPIQYRMISSLVAEVASLTNECLLSSYFLNNGTKEEKIDGLQNIIEVIVSNLFGAVREGKMERDFYNYVKDGNAITKDYMDNLTTESLKKYYGDTVELDEYSKNSWIRRSHYYMNYYLYNYAFCISIASYVASKILSGDKDMLDKYIKYLSTGNDVYPIDAFKILGVDITDKKVYEEAIKYFAKLVSSLDEIIKGDE